MKKTTLFGMSAIALMTFTNGCVTTSPVREDRERGLKTISVFTGSLVEDGSVYKRDFEAAAAKACPSGYEVTERSRRPSTLTMADYDRHYFHWVIKCNKLK